MTQQAAKEKAQRLGTTYTPELTLWEKLWQQSNDFVPLEKEADILLDHNYDGIRELDNHLPPWWTGLFYGTIAFSIVYLLFFHVFDSLPLSTQEYETEVAVAQEQARKFQASNPAPVIDENNVEAVTDVQALADGKQVYLNNCASCHRRDGGGDIGPNLTDEYWLHGGDIKSIFKTVRHGIAGTNMIAWE
jgi:cytochrome c oxidase cbb3-type subunit 3